MAEVENKKRKRKVAIALASVIVGSMIFGAGIFGLKNCFKPDNIPPVQTESPIVTPDPGDPIVTPDPGEPVVTPDPGDPGTPGSGEEQYTEAEYRDMCVEKIEKISKDYIQNNYSKELTNFKFETIDTVNGIVYLRGNVSEIGNKFLSCSLNSEKTNVGTFDKLYNDFLKNATHDDIISIKAEQDLSKLVTTESYNILLNNIVNDQEFVDALNGANIEIASDITEWKDVATVSNVKKHSNQQIDVTFVNLNNNKTITVRVEAYLTIQESNKFQSMIDNMTNKDKSYEVVSVGEFETIAQPATEMNLNQ